jgi:hypothetical protein
MANTKCLSEALTQFEWEVISEYMEGLLYDTKMERVKLELDKAIADGNQEMIDKKADEYYNLLDEK